MGKLLNGPFFRLVSPQIGLVEGEWYSFLVWSRLIESGPDPYDPPVLALETGPPVNNRMQEHILGRLELENDGIITYQFSLPRLWW